MAKIRFTRPCLGSVRRPDVDLLQRDQDGNVIFLTSWWRGAFGQAARAVNRYHRFVDRIHPKLQVEGTITQVKRRYGKGPAEVKIHEGFDEGSEMTCRFAIPGDMKIGQFTQLLEATGDYIGISPYGWKTGMFGHFKVMEVIKVGPPKHQGGDDKEGT